MKTTINSLKSEYGFALPVVLMVVIVFLILVTVVIMHFSSNTQQIIRQEQGLQAHYLARAGVNLGYAAILDNSTGYSHLEEFIADSSYTILTETILFEEGSVVIKAWLDNTSDKIFIEGVATLSGSNVTSRVLLEFHKNTPDLTQWTTLW